MKDLFSKQASSYAQFRPEYPEALYDAVFQHVPQKNTVWDCATGNGQAAKVLCRHFDKVFASDISEKQLAHAHQADNIEYSLQAAERTDFSTGQFDLVTVAQALHWFKFDLFFEEVRRVAKPGALFAAWGYTILTIDNKRLDHMMRDFYENTTEPYWEPERKIIEREYADVPFPFEMLDTQYFSYVVKWHRNEFEGYLNSWSATQKCIRLTGSNMVDDFMLDVADHWGEFERQTIRFPVFLKMGRIR